MANIVYRKTVALEPIIIRNAGAATSYDASETFRHRRARVSYHIHGRSAHRNLQHFTNMLIRPTVLDFSVKDRGRTSRPLYLAQIPTAVDICNNMAFLPH
jgi:hypothetical protein